MADRSVIGAICSCVKNILLQAARSMQEGIGENVRHYSEDVPMSGLQSSSGMRFRG